MWRSPRSWLGMLISALALIWVWSVLASAATRDAFQGVILSWLVPALFLYGAATWMRAWRWAWVIGRPRVIGARQLFPIVAIGYAGNNLLPARAGEILRVVLLRYRHGIGFVPGGVGVVLERILDGALLLAALSVVLVVLPYTARHSLRPIVASVTTFLGLVVFGAVVLVFLARSSGAIVNSWAGRSPTTARYLRLSEALSRVLTALAILRDARAVAIVTACTVLAWAFEYTTYLAVAAAFRLDGQPTTVLVMMVVASLAAAIPAAPGYIGSFHAAGIYTLSLFGIAAGPAAAYTVAVHVVLWAPITLLGTLLWPRFGLSGSSLQSSLEVLHGDAQ